MNAAIKCDVCQGRRVIPRWDVDGSLNYDDCVCVIRYKREKAYETANIPKQYWDFEIKDINAQFRKENAEQLKVAEKYIANLRENIEKGSGLWFCSAPGLGKSTVIVSILKAALADGYNTYFIRASKLLKQKFEALRDVQVSHLMDDLIEQMHILAIEELDKVYLANDDAMNNQLFYEFLSEVYDSKKALLVSSNKLPKEVLRKYPTFVQDRLRSLTPVVFVGLSERRTKAK